MAPRYQSTKSIKGTGFNKYSSNKGFNDVDIPLIINHDFRTRYKKNMSLTNAPQQTYTDSKPKPKMGSDEFHKVNENGLRQAYNAPNYIYKDNDTLYMAGTKTTRDYWDDAKIPFGLTRYSKIYMGADKVLQQDPSIKNRTGHSLVGSVAFELQKNYPERDFTTTTYAAPVVSMTSADNSYRKYGDSVSSLDWGAQSVLRVDPFNAPHSYTGYS